jgi:lipopolysaccharide export system permease protein
MKSISDLIYDDNKALSSAEIQWRLFAPLSTIILILFAFVLGDVAPRQNKYSNLLFAIIIYFIYSNLAIVSVNEVQKNSNLFSFVGTWWVHILALLSCYLIYIIKKLQIKSYNNLKFYIKNYKR